MAPLAAPTAVFAERKAKILQQLAVPDAEYADASPKGSVDVAIRDLIDELNGAAGFVTTSSCAGRVSVFLEGNKTAKADVAEGDEREQVAGVGGKGGGGTWLFLSHEAVALGEDWVGALGFSAPDVAQSRSDGERRLIHFKFEPMILHVLVTSMDHAQLILRCAIQSGFRESGAVNLTSTNDQPATPMVAIRTMGLSFESLIGYETSPPPSSSSSPATTVLSETGGHRHSLVQPEYLTTLMQIANERFSENAKRIDRFRTGFRNALQGPPPKLNPAGQVWEDAAARRERMRNEGLQKKAALKAASGAEETAAVDQDAS